MNPSRILSILLLWTVSLSHAEDDLDVGLAFTKVTTAHFTSEVWRILVDVSFDHWMEDIRNISQQLDNLQQGLDQRYLEILFSTLPVSHEIDLLHDRLNELENDVGELQYMDFGDGIPRSKRAVLPLIGEAIKFCFGNPSSSDLDSINMRFNSLDDTNGGVSHILDIHASLINNTYQMAVDNAIQLADVSQFINQTREAMSKVIRSHASYTDHVNLNIQINSVVSSGLRYVETLINNLEYTLTNFNTALHLASQGKLSQHLLSTKDFYTILKHVENSKLVPQLPFGVNKANMPRFYHNTNVILTHNQGKFRAFLEIPLVNKGSFFTIYEAHSLPYVDPKLAIFNYIAPTFKYLAVASGKTRFAQFNDLDNCRGIEPRFCEPRFPIRTQTGTSCEYAVFIRDQGQIKKNCILRVVQHYDPILIRPASGDDWIYSVSEPVNLIINCVSNSEVRIISGTGHLNLSSRCSAKSYNFEILPHSIQSSNLSAVSPDQKLRPWQDMSIVRRIPLENVPTNDSWIEDIFYEHTNGTLDSTGLTKAKFLTKLNKFREQLGVELSARKDLESRLQNNLRWHVPYTGTSATLDTVISVILVTAGLLFMYLVWIGYKNSRKIRFPDPSSVITTTGSPVSIPLSRVTLGPSYPSAAQRIRPSQSDGHYATISLKSHQEPLSGIGIIPTQGF